MQQRKCSDEEILELLKQGLDQSEVAEQLGVSPAAVSKRLRKIHPQANKPNRQERLRDKLLAVSCAPVDGWLNERDRMEILASLMAKHIDPIQVCAAFTISRDEYQRYLENPHYQQRLEYYRNLAKQAPENAVKLAQGSAYDMVVNLAGILHSRDTKAVVSAAKAILRLARIIPEDKPRIVLNFGEQKVNLLPESPKKLTDDTDEGH